MLVLIHGFWGQPTDWDEFVDQTRRTRDSGEEVVRIDLFAEGPFSSRHGFLGFCQNLQMYVSAKLQPGEAVDVIGYSMGGRLALHWVSLFEQRWRRVWLLSTTPAVVPSVEAGSSAWLARRHWEHEWQLRFRRLPWGELEQIWQAQEVLTTTKSLGLTRRTGGSELRELLALSFSNWSHLDHRITKTDLCVGLPRDTTWWFGGLDSKYLSVKAGLEGHNIPGTFQIVEGSGHRLLLEDSERLAKSWVERSS